MPPDQIGNIKSGNLAVLDDPAAADHHPVGAMRAAEHERRQRIAGPGKAQLVELEQRQIGHRAKRDLADVVAADAGGRALGRPAQRIAMADLADAIAARCTRKAARTSCIRFDASFEAEPSTPRPMPTPAASMAQTGQVPEASV